MVRRSVLVLVIFLIMVAPAVAAGRAVSFGEVVREQQSEDVHWRRIASEQETGQSCESRELSRLVIRHPPIPDAASPGAGPERKPCNVLVVLEALREQKPVELDNVVITGTLDFREATAPALQGDLRLRRSQLPLLQQWLDERRREHRAPEMLPGQTRFRSIGVPIVIRNSRLEAVRASAEDPILFTEPVDLRGTRVGGPVSFVGAVFMEPVSLEDVELVHSAAFTRAHFDAGVDFSRATLRGEARFDGATFSSRALSRPAGRGRRLAETPALFIGATFAKAVTFRDAVFESRADFRKVSFEGETEFVAARFQRLADFGHARFRGPLEAANAVFAAAARFPSAVFDKAATFRRTEFRGHADFALAIFGDAASTFRDAQFGPAVFFPRHPADVGTSLRRLGDTAGYDFRQTTFADKARTLARADFQVHWVFALVTVAVAGLGLLVALATRRPRLLDWCRAAETEAVARICKAEHRGWSTLAWRRPASPREQLADGAFLIAGYGVLAVGLATHYQTQATLTVDRTVIWLYPVAGLVAWTIAGAAALNPFTFRSAHMAAAPPPPVKPTPMLDYFDPAYHVPRRCDEFVRNFVSRVPTGVLGLAGPPGAGRSALARAVLDGLTHRHASETAPAAPILAVTMSSPPAGDLVAFFSVLFRRVGQEARREVRRRLFTFERGSRALADAAEELIQSPPAVALLPLAVVAASVMFFLASPWWSPSPTGGTSDRTPWLLLGSIAGCAIVYYGYVVRRQTLRRALHELPSGRLYIQTERVLERLAFEESTTEEREAGLALPRGLSLRRRRARALKERTITLATVVDDFGRYVGDLRHVFHRGVVVHIDDADRIEEVNDVRDLVLRLKGTLVGGVLFLVPLPHVVLDGYRFATEGPAGAVAGMLDDLIVVPPMTLDEALHMLGRRKFFGAEGLGVTICLLAGGIPKEILRLLRRVTSEGRDWTAKHLVDLSAREAQEGARHAVLHSALSPTAKERVLRAVDRDDDAIRAELVATEASSAEPSGGGAALLDVLGRFDRRRQAIHALRARLDDLKRLEGTFVAHIATGTPIGSLESWLEQLRRSFVAVETGVAAGGPSA